jgi:kynurenine formamidase
MPDYKVDENQLLGWIDSLSNWGRWGDDDEMGTLNNLSPELTKKALALVEDGTTVSCAAPLTFNQAELDVPRPPVHYMVGAGEAYRPGDGPGRQVAMDFFGMIFHGHTVTHLDSHAHFMWDGHLYNGRPSSSVKIREGATQGDITVAHKGIVTRGVLVDAARGRGVDFIERGDGVSLADIQKAEKDGGFKVGKGDVLLMRTGQFGERQRSGPVDVNIAGSSGPLPELLPFFKDRDIAVMGTDTGNDVAPTQSEIFTNPVHQVFIPAMGGWILDNAWLDDLADECARRGRWEFLINILPLRLNNVTGSPVNPVAVF